MIEFKTTYVGVLAAGEETRGGEHGLAVVEHAAFALASRQALSYHLCAY